MRERALREFEAVFEQASIPVLDIQEVTLRKVSVVVKGIALDASVLKLGDYFRERHGATVVTHWVDGFPEAVDDARHRGMEVLEQSFASTAELVGQVSIAKSQLVVVGEHEEVAQRVVDFDDLVVGMKPPVLVLRKEIDRAEDVFNRILHSLTGRFRQTQNFAYSFSMVPTGGRVMLLHMIDENELADVREVLEGEGSIDDVERATLLERLAHVGERYLKGVVASQRGKQYDVAYRLGVGDVLTSVRDELSRGDYGLVIVGCHHEGHSHVEAADYQLMHEVSEVPVLAL